MFLRAFKTYPYTSDLKERLLSPTSLSPATRDFTKCSWWFLTYLLLPLHFTTVSYLALYFFISSRIAEASYLQDLLDFPRQTHSMGVFSFTPFPGSQLSSIHFSAI